MAALRRHSVFRAIGQYLRMEFYAVELYFVKYKNDEGKSERRRTEYNP